MTTIYAATNDQVLVATILPALSRNNVNTVRLWVDFDSAWDGVTARSAVFSTSKSVRPYEVPLSSEGYCLIPAEVLAEEGRLYITVKGVNAAAGTTKASTRLTVKVLPGTPTVFISDPTPGVYQQLLTENAVLRSRMNTMETEGTVEGSEVEGIRTGADGTEYDNAGDAVREQVKVANYARWLLDNLTTARGRNIADLDDPDVILGGYYNSLNQHTEAEEYNQTGFVKVEEGKSYTSSDTKRSVNWYTSNRAFLGSTSSQIFSEQGYVDAPEGACYARFIGLSADWGAFQVVEGRELPVYAPFDRMIDSSKVPTSTRIITPQATNFFSAVGKNLFDPTDADIVIGGYYKGPVYVEAPTHNQTGYIPVVEGEVYTCSYTGGFVDWFDAMKGYISTTASQEFNNAGHAVAPEGACYARFVATVAAWEKLQVEKGTAQTGYEPYTRKIPKELLDIHARDLSNLIFVSYGDSIVAREQWQKYVCDCFGFSHTNLGIGSTTMALVDSVESEYPCMINDDRIQAIIDSNADILVIMGGTNDCHRRVYVGTEHELTKALPAKDRTTFIGAYSYLIETLLTWKPTLQILLMTPMHSVYEIQNGYDYNVFTKAVRTVAEYYAIPVADTSKKSGISKFDYTTYTTDGLHPNEIGARKIANVVIAAIRESNIV